MRHTTLKVHPKDDVIVALCDLAQGQEVEYEGESYKLVDSVEAKHKFATRDFAVNDIVTMYGVKVGVVTKPIPRGGCITTENLKHASEGFAVGNERNTNWTPPDITRFEGRTFNGFHRSDGRVGTRNHWVVVPLVFCQSRNIRVMREAMLRELGYDKGATYEAITRSLIQMHQAGATAEQLLEAELSRAEETAFAQVFPNVDGLKFLDHSMGCATSKHDTASFTRLLAGYLVHPNVAGVTVLSLGCQYVQVERLQKEIQAMAPDFNKPMHVFEQQKVGTEQDLVTAAMKQTFAGMAEADKCQRKPAPLSELCIGMECGGSDGFSGISANPTVGQVSDLCVAVGGSAMLAEFPELCGVEQELIDRCVDEKTAKRFAHLMEAYEKHVTMAGDGFESNPSPGNIRDGLITDAMKSAGAAKKGGTSPVQDVIDYCEQYSKKGLTLCCTPGGDVESTTAMAGSGANLMIFTTGLGTPTGNAITPTLKVSTNTTIYDNMPDIIDFNTGSIISGENTIEQAGEDLFEMCVATASGERLAKAEELGQDDFIPWKRDISL